MTQPWIDTVWPLPGVAVKAQDTTFRSEEWVQCAGCHQRVFKEALVKAHGVCPHCSHPSRLSAHAWFDLLTDGSGDSIGEHVKPQDFLSFSDRIGYPDRLEQAQQRSGASEALLCKTTRIGNVSVVLSVFEFGFIGGSMGYVVGERFVQSVHEAIVKRLPLVCVTASGGARMQEGVVGLFQMAKVSAAIARLKRHGLAFITVLADPTSGGVAASLAMQADIILAERAALIGFTGPRVIAQTLKESLPEGFQRAAFLYQHGAVDQVVDRLDLPMKLARLLAKLTRNIEHKKTQAVG